MNLIRLWKKLLGRRKLQFCVLLILMVLSSFLEIISLGAVIPFLGVLTAPEYIYSHPYAQPIIPIFKFSSPDELVLPLTILFILAAMIASSARVLLTYILTRLSYAIGADLSIGIYRRTLYQEYSVHLSRNSSEVVNGIINKTDIVVGGIVTPVLVFISATILMIGVIGALIAINPIVTIFTILGFGTLYSGVIFFTSIPLKKNSISIAYESNNMIKSLQEGLGGIRDVIIDGSQEFYCNLYQSADLPYRRSLGTTAFIGESPRYIMEGLGMTVIAVLAYVMSQSSSPIQSAIPVLGAFALGAQRLLPAMQQIYRSFSAIKSSKVSFEDVLNLLDQPLPAYLDKPNPKPIKFTKSIKIKNLSFRYSKESPEVLSHVNLNLVKGSRVGFVGATGSGKSTLLDIIMGILEPTMGILAIDDKEINNINKRSWQAHIAHVPQNIFLSDSPIANNIAFGVAEEQIDMELVKKAAKKAHIAELIEKMPNKYQTYVGEQGVRLSGGQRQRIGIARALYKKSDVLIFDEATSALDSETEKTVMNSIRSLDSDLTVLIIAHRVSTLKDCDQIYEVTKEGVKKTTYQEIS